MIYLYFLCVFVSMNAKKRVKVTTCEGEERGGGERGGERGREMMKKLIGCFLRD